MTYSQADVDSAFTEARRHIAARWGWFLALGIILVVVGVAAILFPFVSGLATAIAIGWLLIIGGVVMVLHALTANQWRGFWWGLLLGILYVAAGAYLLRFPAAGLVSLTILLAALFVIEGVIEAIIAWRIRPHEGWGWLLFSGLVAIAVGVLIALQLPSSAAWAIGLLTGINLISTGWGFVFVALAGRRAAQGLPATA